MPSVFLSWQYKNNVDLRLSFFFWLVGKEDDNKILLSVESINKTTQIIFCKYLTVTDEAVF